MLALSVDNVCFSIGAKDILENISFSVNEGDRVGVVGVNGAGKTTLLRILTGEIAANSGSVFLKKGARVAMLRQNESVSGDNTPYEELLQSRPDILEDEERLKDLTRRMEEGEEGLEVAYHALHERFMENGGYEYKGRVKGILKSLGFAEDLFLTKISALSGGQKTRLALAKILYVSPDILILDEPTNHLDVETLSWLEDYLRNYRKTVIAVSHDRWFLDRVCRKILDLERGEAKLYNGNYSEFAEKKKKDREIAERHYRNQQKEIKRIEEYIALQRRWNRERNIIAAESRQKALDRMEKLERPENDPQSISLSFRAGLPSGEDVLTVKHLKKSYPPKILFEDLSFEVKKGDRLLIIGHNGCGKSTLLKILMSRAFQDEGGFSFGYNVTCGYYDQENQNLHPGNTVLDELWNTDPTLPQTVIRTALARYQFKGEDVAKEVGVLSGGERARLTFAKLILKENNLLLLDEPTNHLDIASKEVLEDALEGYDGTLICVSHDRYFIDKLATRILDFDGPDHCPVYYAGGYGEYLRHKAYLSQRAAESGEEKSRDAFSENKKSYLENKKSQAEKRKKRASYERALQKAAQTEREIDRITLLEKEHETDYVMLDSLSKERAKLEEELLSLYETIEELSPGKEDDL